MDNTIIIGDKILDEKFDWKPVIGNFPYFVKNEYNNEVFEAPGILSLRTISKKELLVHPYTNQIERIKNELETAVSNYYKLSVDLKFYYNEYCGIEKIEVIVI